jgi:hypothetical protein
MFVIISWMCKAIKMGNFKKILILNLWTVSCNSQLIQSTLLARGLLTAGYKGNNRNDIIPNSMDSKSFSWTALHVVVGLFFNAKLISSPVSPNYTVQGTTNSNFFSYVSQSLQRKGDNKLKHTHHYNSIISVLKEQPANPFQMSIIFTTLTQCH